MAISSDLSLIPYPQENYQLQRLSRPAMLPERELGKQAAKRYQLYRPAFTRQHYIYMDDQNLTYSPSCCMKSSLIDHTGSRIDIYI